MSQHEERSCCEGIELHLPLPPTTIFHFPCFMSQMVTGSHIEMGRFSHSHFSVALLDLSVISITRHTQELVIIGSHLLHEILDRKLLRCELPFIRDGELR